MKHEREIAFLESLYASREEDLPVPQTACPEPAILWSLTRPEQAGDAATEHLREHLKTCAACREIADRLTAFAVASGPGPSVLPAGEWQRAAPILRERMTEFLDAHPTRVATSPMRPAATRSGWRFPRLSWGLQLSMAGCAAAVLLFGLLLQHRNSRPNLFPVTGVATEAQQQPGPSASADRSRDHSHDHSMLMSDTAESQRDASQGVPQSGHEDLPETLRFDPGELLSLSVTAVNEQQDGRYKVAGKLLPLGAAQGTLATSEITAILTPAATETSPILLVEEIRVRGKSYRPLEASGEQQLVTRMALVKEEVPRIGEIVTLQVLRSRHFGVSGSD